MRFISIILCCFSLVLGSSITMADSPSLNEMLPAYAKAFAGKSRVPFQIPHPELLDVKKLDGSVSSLSVVDSYLSGLYKDKANLTHRDISMVSMLVGAYIGQTIIGASKKGHQWILLTEYAKKHPTTKRSEPESVYTEYVLTNKAETLSMPINQVAHYLDSGKTFSAKEYALEQLK